ncbi:MAG: bacillithiol biosynthesis BshC [Planctomycetes bacterium]|nr:bacillithiol biosynthesis BshC [Planctomycetota bacterium]
MLDRFALDPRNADAVLSRARAQTVRGLEPEMADRLEPGPASDKLKRGAAAVLTGQQPSVGLGPLYNFYKAVSAVRWARWLEAGGVPAVPIFWNHSDDDRAQDFDRLAMPDREGGMRRARVRLSGDGVLANREARLDAEDLLDLLPQTPYRAEILDLFLSLHRGPVAADFTRFLKALFGAELLVFEPAQITGGRAASVFERALADPGKVRRAVEAGAERLRGIGFQPAMAAPRGPGVYLIREGRRVRVEAAGNALVAAGETFSARALLAERLSAGAALRCVLQDSVFPVALYVGGPNEVAYIAQLAELYEAFGVTAPAVAPRISATLLEPRVARAASDAGLDPRDLLLGEAELLRRRAAHSHGQILAAAEDMSRETADRFARLAARLDAMGGTPRSLARKTEAKIGSVLEAFRRRLEESLRAIDGVAAGRIRRVSGHVTPEGRLQERMFPIWYYLAIAGPSAAGRLLASLDPRAEGHAIVWL